MFTETLLALFETLIMIFASGFFAFGVGLPLGVLLVTTKRNHIWENVPFNTTLGFIINVTRSIPFIILMISITPLTRLLVGTSIGVIATLVPLSLAAIPFFARTVETSLKEVSPGLIEAAQAMGATPMQIVRKVLVPEALSGIVSGLTLTLVNLVGYSAMAGAIGGGGLGTLAYHHGYQRFDTGVMLITVVVLVVLVQIIQWGGDYVSHKVLRH